MLAVGSGVATLIRSWLRARRLPRFERTAPGLTCHGSQRLLDAQAILMPPVPGGRPRSRPELVPMNGALVGLHSRDMDIGAIVVTYERPDPLRRCLAGLLAQSHPLVEIVVVNNGGSLSLNDVLPVGCPIPVRLVEGHGNVGFGAGLAIGVRASLDSGTEAVWMSDDDSCPGRDAVASSVKLMANAEKRIGIVCTQTGLDSLLGVRWNAAAPSHRRVGLVDQALLSLGGASHFGLPREDFFMMFEDVEYCRRIRRSGWEVAAADGEVTTRLHLGSTGANSGSAWRLYYQARNELRTALDSRSARYLVAWLIRQLKISLAEVARSRDSRPTFRFRAAGTADALRGRMNRTIAPGADSVARAVD